MVTPFDLNLHTSKSVPMSLHSPHPPVRDEYEFDDCDQPPIISGYRGINTRSAITVDSVPPAPDPHARVSTWADRPRGNTLPGPLPTDLASGHTSPVVRPFHRVTSDSNLSSQGGSIGSGSALRMSTRTSSEASDTSRRTAIKSVSFVTHGGDGAKMAKSPPPEQVHHVPRSIPSSSIPSSARSSGSLRSTEKRMLSLGMSIRDKARFSTTSLSSSRRQQRRAAAAGKTPSQDLGSEVSATLSLTDQDHSVAGSLHPSSSHMGASSSTSHEQDYTSRSDSTFPRQESELSRSSIYGSRPISAPHQTFSNFDSPPSSDRSNSVRNDAQNGNVFISRGNAEVIQHPRRRGGLPIGYANTSPTPATKNLSFLECVVETLKGSSVMKRKSFMHASEAQIWLTYDMKSVRYKMNKKGSAPVVHTLPFSEVRKLKGGEREISFEMVREKKAVEFIFLSRERADIWLSGICCLVPSYTSVKSRNRHLERKNYDPFLDSWNGKQLALRKRLNGYVLLGSIGRGSFGKVKLSLYSKDGLFYAVKVLSKAMMRKRIRSVPVDRSLRDSASAQLTVADVNEIVVMKDLHHENIMRMKGVFDDVEEDRLYIVLEFLAKGPIMSSAKLTGATPISEDRARSAFIDVLTGLEYLHHSNIAHRDIKPDNLLESGDGTVKISDFGAAVLYKGEDRFVVDESQSSTSVGTPAFTAPELCMSENSPPCPSRCYAADIWSLGATLFYMVYGRAPFIARSVFEMYDAICSQNLEFPKPSDISKNLEDLIRQLLEKSPAKRATISSIVCSPWLTESVEIAGKLHQLRAAISSHKDRASNSSDRGYTASNRFLPDMGAA